MAIDYKLAHIIVDYMNELIKLDRPAVGALIANRVPCNEAMADHPTLQCSAQHGGHFVGLLGLLNGLCGTDEKQWGAIEAVFAEHVPGRYSDLERFEVRRPPNLTP